MAQSYTRQSTFADGDTISASLFNNEYNQLVNSFAYSSTSAVNTGHRHDGTAGQGGNIFKIGDLDFLNKIEVDGTNNRLGFYVEVSSAAVEQVRIQDGVIVPVTDNDIDLGTSSLQFKDLYINGTANLDSLVLGSGSTVTAILDEDDLTSDSATSLATQQSIKAYVDAQVTAQDFDFAADSGGALSIDLDSESMTFTGGTGIDTSGSGNAVTFAIDSTVATLTGSQTLTNKTITSPDINGGTVDGATIATSDITVGAGKTLDVSAGTLTLADNQISGNKVEGGTIAATTITDLTFGSLNDGTITVTAFVDEDNMSSDSATLVPTQQSVKAYVDSQVTAQDLDLTTDSGTIAIDLDSETLTVTGGTGIDSSATGNAVTLAIDSTVATLTGSQTLTNKTLTTPVVSGNLTTDGLIDGRDVATDGTKLDGIEASATADQTDAEIKTAYENNSDTNAFTDAEKTKLSGVEASADVTDTANVTAAGALMDSELTAIASVKALNQGVATTDSPAFTNLTLNGTGSVKVPAGTTAQRDGSPAAGMFRYNSSLAQFEGYTDAWGSIGGGGGTNTFTTDSFTGNGSTTAYALSQTVSSEDNLLVFIEGVFQQQDAYSIATSGGTTTLTFSSAPANNNSILIYSVAAGVSGSNLNIDSMTGDGSDVTLTLTIAPVNENNTQVFIDGVYQNKSTYSISGTTLTFSTAPPNGSAVEVMTMTQTDINVPVDGTITSAKLSGDLVTPGALDVTGTVTADGAVIQSDGATVTVSSADYEVALLGRRGSSGVDLDKGFLRLKDTGTNKVVLDSAGDSYFNGGSVGIGTSSPTRALSVFGDTAGVISITSNSTDGISSLAFGDTADDNAGRVNYLNASDAMLFYTATSERLRIDSSGNVSIGATSATARLEVTGAFGFASGANSLATTVSKAAARIRGSSDASTSLFFGSLTNDAEQYIQSSNGAGSAADDLALNPYGGNVGIGISSPNALLHVGGTAETQGSQANPAIQIGSTSGYRLGMYTDAEGGYIENKNGDNGLIFRVKTAGEAMRIDGGSGNVLVGKTDTAIATEGTFIGGGSNNGLVEITRDGSLALRVNRTSDHGQMIRCDKDGVIHGRLGTGGSYFFIAGGTAGSTHSGIRFVNDGSQRPCTSTGGNFDNTVTWGSSTARWEVIYAASSTINTSDRNEKQDIEALSDAEQRVAVAAKGLMRKYRWRNAVAAKGDDARIHFGIIAQDLQDAFTAEGLDAARYAMWCSDTFWVDSEGETYDTQEEAPEGATEKTRLGVRYSELLAFIIAAI